MIMGKLSVLDGEGVMEIEDLTMEELTIEETLEELMAGKVLLMTTYDNRRDKDILVRVKETSNGKVTQVSKPTSNMEGFMGTRKYWSLYDISINSLSLYPTYVFDPNRYNVGYKFEPSSMVTYTSGYGDMDVAVIDRVFRDTDGGFHYTLSGEGDRTFKEEELIHLKD